MPIAREIFFVGSMGVPVDAPLTYIAALMGQIGLASVASRHITDELRDQLREVGSVKASIPLAELRSVISPSIDIDRHRIRLDLSHLERQPPSSVVAVGSDGLPSSVWVASLDLQRQWDMIVSFEAKRGQVDLPGNFLEAMIAGPIIAGGLIGTGETFTRGPIETYCLPAGLTIVAPLHQSRVYSFPAPEPVAVPVGSLALPPGGP